MYLLWGFTSFWYEYVISYRGDCQYWTRVVKFGPGFNPLPHDFDTLPMSHPVDITSNSKSIIQHYFHIGKCLMLLWSVLRAGYHKLLLVDPNYLW